MLLSRPRAAGACRPGLHRWEAIGVETHYTWFAGTLVVAAGSALWGAVLCRQRRGAPGSGPLMWLMLAIAHWCLTSALHTVTPAMAVRVFWAKMQYLAIPSVPPLWLLFALDYGQWRGGGGGPPGVLLGLPPACPPPRRQPSWGRVVGGGTDPPAAGAGGGPGRPA